MRADPKWKPDTTAYPTSPKFIDLAGQKFSRLTVVEYAGKKDGKPFFRCLCDCGNIVVAMSLNLIAARTKSCGCLHSEITSETHKKHGHATPGRQTTEYRIWQSMWTRCTNPKSISWKWYGARGIGIDPRWKSFDLFLADMGMRPSRKLTLDRTDNDKDYGPNNCRWATGKQQAANRRKASTNGK